MSPARLIPTREEYGYVLAKMYLIQYGSREAIKAAGRYDPETNRTRLPSLTHKRHEFVYNLYDTETGKRREIPLKYLNDRFWHTTKLYYRNAFEALFPTRYARTYKNRILTVEQLSGYM